MQESTKETRPKGWYSRGYLPHFDKPDIVQAVTFRLADSLPANFLDQCESQLRHLPKAQRNAEKAMRIANFLDRGHGSCWLSNRSVAETVENTLLYFNEKRYVLLAWCVMPNHVHTMIETKDGFPLADVIHSWKSFSAKESNRILSRTGEFWMRDYFDRIVRNEFHYQNALNYIEENPVKAGLVASREEWRRSSAWKGRKNEHE
ncbi:MAG TPA: transposase [Planctomycetota bacterium]|nr:transposase [Planctomycetota bacterium]